MSKKPLFYSNNSLVAINRKEALHVADFLEDLKEVFEKHKVNTIKEGYIGFNKEGQFGIVGSELDISENE